MCSITSINVKGYATSMHTQNLKFIGIVENTNDSTDNQNAAKSSDFLHSENTKDVLFKFLEDELNVTDARKRIEFQRVHCLGKPRSSGNLCLIIARFLCYQDREQVMQKARAKLKGKDYAVLKTSPKNYTTLEKGRRTSLNAPGKMVLRLSSVRNFQTGCILMVNLYH